MLRLLLALSLLATAACSTSGKPLPMISQDDPIWTLELPR